LSLMSTSAALSTTVSSSSLSPLSSVEIKSKYLHQYVAQISNPVTCWYLWKKCYFTSLLN
jgi:hypothetical protein